MLELTPEDHEHLSRGGTLVVPSVQRAAAVRLAYGAAQLAAGVRTWSTPRVLAWGAWLDQGLDEARARGVAVPGRLSQADSWWLWRQAVRLACVEELQVLWPDGLIDPVRRATLLLEDFGITLRDAATAEAAVLLRAQTQFADSCDRRQVIWSSSWRACSDYLVPSTPTRLVGFDELGPARHAWLRSLGIGIRADESAAPAGSHSVRALEDPEQEALAASDWCARQLERDPRARLLVVVARLSEQRHLWLRALSRRMDGEHLLGSAAPGDMNSVAVEGGEPLDGYPLVSLALQILSLASGDVDFSHLSPVLRSPYLASSSIEPRLATDLWLREHNIELRWPQLPALLPALARAAGDAAGEVLQQLLRPLDSGAEAGVAPGSPADWARRFARTLLRAGWPGAQLSSAEQQQRLRFEELLGELAAITTDTALAASQALALLRQLAAQTAFEPATDDAPVTLTASLADPIAIYDGIWVAGLTAAAWPQATHPDPMVPWALQRAAGMPGADPAAPLRHAERALQRWRRSSRELVLSYPRAEADLRHEPSALLELSAPPASTGLPLATAPLDLEEWFAQRAPRLEALDDRRGPPWPQGSPLRGGARLLELQALCPFHAFAELRLRATPLAEPSPGLDPRVRGQILHHALELFWGEISDSAALHARRAELAALARDCIERALRQAQQRSPGGLDPQLLRHEATRDARLFETLIDWELTRGPFAVVALERPADLTIGGTALRLRLDRVDRLPDGRLIVFDYKTGAAEPFNALAERLRRPQLPAYGVVTGELTAAVTALYLTPKGLKIRGVADREGRVPELRGVKPGQPAWEALLEQWRVALAGLMAEYLGGEARVDPLSNACDFCHLRSLCRIQPAPVTEPEDLGPEPETP